MLSELFCRAEQQAVSHGTKQQGFWREARTRSVVRWMVCSFRFLSELLEMRLAATVTAPLDSQSGPQAVLYLVHQYLQRSGQTIFDC